MKNKLQKTMKMVFTLCLAAVMICSTVLNAQAAGYVQSFTKTINLKGGHQCVIQMELKNASSINVAISTASKKKDLNIHATVPQASEYLNYTMITGDQKKGVVRVSLKKGVAYIYLTNYGMDTVKVKMKVAAKNKILKYKKQEITDNIG